MCAFSNFLKLFSDKIENGIQVDRASDVLDTYLVEAVVLLTGKMDRNLVYREALKNTTGEDAISTDTIVAIISITVPVVVGNVFQKI